MKYFLGISNFLEDISRLSYLLFSSISLHWSLRKSFLSLLAILCNSAFKWVYLSFSPLIFASLLFTAICKVSSDSHFAFFQFFILGMVLIPDSCTMHESLSIVLTECGPLEKEMANHFSILALRIPWTVWKGKTIRQRKMNSPGQ